MKIVFSNKMKAENVYAAPFIRHRFKKYKNIEAVSLEENETPTPDYYLKPANALLEIKRILQTQIIEEVMLSETIKNNLDEEIKSHKYANPSGYYIHIYPFKCPIQNNWKKLLSKHQKSFISALIEAISKNIEQIDFKKAYIKAIITRASYIIPNNILFHFSECGFFDVEGFINEDVIRLLQNAERQLSNNKLSAERRILLLHYQPKNEQFNEWILSELENRNNNILGQNIDEIWVGNGNNDYIQLFNK